MEDIIDSLGLAILSLTPGIAALAESGIMPHGDPSDRLIAATTIAHQTELITVHEKLQSTAVLLYIW